MPPSPSRSAAPAISPARGIGWGAIAAAVAAQVWLFRSYIVDDAFISFRYAEHWAAGAGPVYNLGERVEGYTNFAWVALLTGVHALGIDTVAAAKAASVVFAVVTLLLTARLAARLGPGAGWLSLVAPALLASNGLFFRNALNGLETGMLGAIALVAVGLLDGVVSGRRPAVIGMAAVLPWMALTRPDAVLWVVALGAVAFADRARADAAAPRASRWVVSIPWLACALVLAGHEAWRLAYYGQPFPNTYYAKLGGESRLALFQSGVAHLFYFQGGLGGILVVCACIAAVLLDRSRLVRTLAALVAIRAAFVLYSGGETMEQGRFMAPCIPMIYLLAQALLVQLWRRAGRPRVGFAAAALIAAPLAAWNGWDTWTVWREARAYAANLERTHVSLGRALAARTREDAVIAIGDAGAVPYYSGRTAIDLWGLNDARIGRLPGPFGDKVDLDYLWSRHPDFIVIWSYQPPEAYRFHSGKTVHDRVIEQSDRFQRDYEMVDGMEFEPGSYQILFRRRAGGP